MSLNPTQIFVNLSKKNKKAVTFKMPDGKHYSLTISHIEDMVSGKRKATTLSEIILDEQTEA